MTSTCIHYFLFVLHSVCKELYKKTYTRIHETRTVKFLTGGQIVVVRQHVTRRQNGQQKEPTHLVHFLELDVCRTPAPRQNSTTTHGTAQSFQSDNIVAFRQSSELFSIGITANENQAALPICLLSIIDVHFTYYATGPWRRIVGAER